MSNRLFSDSLQSRRDFLRTGMFGLGIGASMPLVFRHGALAIAAESFLAGKESHPERIMVVVELSGGNDGLNTVVPYTNDKYYKARPTLGIRKESVIKLNDTLGLHPAMTGLKSIWDSGEMAIVQGCGYPNPNRSHFTSMEYWHTATPNVPESRGWVGRFADQYWPEAKANTLINIASKQSLAVQSNLHAPIVFSDPNRFVRAGDPSQEMVYKKIINQKSEQGNKTLSFLKGIDKTAVASSALVRESIAKYKTPVSYGSESSVSTLSSDLKKVTALIASGFPTRVYYTMYGGFDTHAAQAGSQQQLLMYASDALEGFFKDLKRINRANDVAVMMFTEFGRRVEENQSGGTDHGTATPMYLLGPKVKGGLYGTYPSLDDLDPYGDLKMTTDFRRVYATMIKEWMGCDDAKSIIKGDFETLKAFA